MTAQHETLAAGGEMPGTEAGSTSTGSLMQQAVEQASRLISAEVQLAKREVSETVRSGVVALIAGSAAAFFAIAFLVMAVVTVVVAVSLPWAASLGFALFFLAVAATGGMIAIRRLKRISPLRQTVETIQEDVTWAKQQLTRDER
ncbi:MAG TPA: phage holin family protein [Candidatus Dormibacteraeota bacterium]